MISKTLVKSEELLTELTERKNMMLDAIKVEFIEFMMQADVLRFGEFKTKSGRITPYFINTGNYKTGKQIATLGKFYAKLIQDTCGESFDAMFGPAYKGIPLVTTTAVALATEYDMDKTYFFNRKEAKDHGEGGNLVGYQPKDGDRVIIVEDVITAGTAIRETMPLLKNAADVIVDHMFISVNRCEVGQNPNKTAIMEVSETYGMKVHSIISVQDIYEFLKTKDMDEKILNNMENYMKKYCIFE